MSEAPWIPILNELIEFLNKYDKNREFKFRDRELEEKFRQLEEKFLNTFILSFLGREIEVAKKWIEYFMQTMNDTLNKLKLSRIILSKEFRSFVEDPLSHLRKKLFIYFHDLLRNRLSVDQFESKGLSAINTSLKTNMRTLYQDWVFLTILKILADYDSTLIYPEHGAISLERHGKQKLGHIPPNAIMLTPNGYLSFFIEAPRPITWEDTSDLVKAWKLYTALRPDMMVYGGKVLDILQLDKDPPIKTPDIIIECKELDDWFERVRYIRGPFAKPLTAERWRAKWIEGLWDGLANILGVERKEAMKIVEEKKYVKLLDRQVVTLYYSVYKPKAMFVISRARVPSYVKEDLERVGINVIDNVQFNESNLKILVDELLKYAKYSQEDYINMLIYEIQQKIQGFGYKLSRQELLKQVLEFVESRIEDFVNYLRSRSRQELN